MFINSHCHNSPVSCGLLCSVHRKRSGDSKKLSNSVQIRTHVGPSPKPESSPHCSPASLSTLCPFTCFFLVAILLPSSHPLSPRTLAMPLLTAGTTFKQLEGHPSCRSPNHQLLQAPLESACLSQENGNTCSQISALLAGSLCPLSAPYSSTCSPHVGAQ